MLGGEGMGNGKVVGRLEVLTRDSSACHCNTMVIRSPCTDSVLSSKTCFAFSATGKRNFFADKTNNALFRIVQINYKDNNYKPDM